MTREEHIAKAEALLQPWSQNQDYHPDAHDIALAQVHATLALTAAPSEPVRPQLDPELVAAVEEILAETPRHWWSRVMAR